MEPHRAVARDGPRASIGDAVDAECSVGADAEARPTALRARGHLPLADEKAARAARQETEEVTVDAHGGGAARQAPLHRADRLTGAEPVVRDHRLELEEAP